MPTVLIKSEPKGRLVVIDGTDGSGKATQSKLLHNYLKNHKISYGYFDFPQYQGSFFGRFIGKFLRGELGDPGTLNAYLISLPYALDRWQANARIRLALQRKKLVICNRYASSNMAYQISRADSKHRYNLFRWLKTLEYKEFGIPKEDLVIFLYVPFSFAQRLLVQKELRSYLKGARKDIVEQDLNLLKKVDQTYLWLLKQSPNWVRVDCVEKNRLLSKQAIHEKVVTLLRARNYL